jgi:hypothetical protein
MGAFRFRCGGRLRRSQAGLPLDNQLVERRTISLRFRHVCQRDSKSLRKQLGLICMRLRFGFDTPQLSHQLGLPCRQVVLHPSQRLLDLHLETVRP